MAGDLSIAITAFRSGRFPEADGLCRQFLAANPDHCDALNLMGAIAGMAGEHREAVRFISRAVVLSPDVLDYRKNLARAFLHLGEAGNAEKVLSQHMSHSVPPDVKFLWGTIRAQQEDLVAGIGWLEEAAQAAPLNTEYLVNLGELYRRNREFAKARAALEKSLTLNPNLAVSLNNLAGLQLADGSFLDALHSIQKLLAIQPRSAQAYFNLASLLGGAGDNTAAALALRNALIIDPTSVRSRLHLANVLVREGQLDEAESIVLSLRDAEGVDPVYMKTIHVRILERKGKLEEAWKIIETFGDEIQSNTDAAIMLALLQEQRGDVESAVKTLERTVSADHVAALEGIGLHFTLGQLYDSLGYFDKAFAAYYLGNENRKKTFIFFAERDEQKVDDAEQIRKLFSRERFDACPVSDLSTEMPVFVLGMPRSGTTLTEQILSCHSAVSSAGELTAFQDAIHDTYSVQKSDASALSLQLTDPSEGRNCLVPADWDTMTVACLNPIGKKYLDRLKQVAGDASRVTDKMPYNYFIVGVIAKVFPNAKIIHCQRHPLDTCLSCYFQNFTAGSHFSFDLKELGEHYLKYQSIMQTWNDLGIKMFHSSYEQLVSSPEQTVRKLLEFCGLDWEPECMNFSQSKRVVSTASYQQVRKPLYTKSVGRWKHYVHHLKPLIDALQMDFESLERESKTI